MVKIKQNLFYENRIKCIDDAFNERNYGTILKDRAFLEDIKGDKQNAWEIHGAITMDAFRNCLKNQTHIMYIDDMVADSLYNEKHTNINYEKTIHLPFPYIFFEFEKPISTIDLNGDQKEIGGSFCCKRWDLKQQEIENMDKHIGTDPFIISADTVENYENKFQLMNFFVGGQCFGIPSLTEEIIFDRKTLNFTFNYNGNKYFYDFNKKILQKLNIPKHIYGHENNEPEFIKINDENISEYISKRIDLAINLINYINAQNIVIRKVSRESRSQHDLDRINKKRQREGKNQLAPLKPYYIVEVKKSYIDEDEKGNQGLWSLENRVWVRGHFRHYEDGRAPRWIEPYIKGPKDAPWKHNRYSVLYKNFKHLLPRRGDEAD